MEYSLPEKNEAEITLIGTGGGYGESCVVHYGNDNWLVVDSCIDPFSKTCLPLEYLIRLNVPLSNVKLVLCTHWHHDHIRGLSQLVGKCKNSAFCFGKALDHEKFLYWVSLDYQKLKDEPLMSSSSEFINCIKIIKARGSRVVLAYPDRTLEASGDASIISLSPSDFTIEQFDHEISQLIESFGVSERKCVINTPNDKSVVLLLRLGHHRAILGADLEVSQDARKGWLSILDNSMCLDKKATLFKIPHHGSQNGYHERIWAEALEEAPLSKLTPYKNSGLPQLSMSQLYAQKSSKLFMTATPLNNYRPKKRDKASEKLISFFNNSVSEVKYNKGIVRSRILMDDPTSIWKTEIDGEAFAFST